MQQEKKKRLFKSNAQLLRRAYLCAAVLLVEFTLTQRRDLLPAFLYIDLHSSTPRDLNLNPSSCLAKSPVLLGFALVSQSGRTASRALLTTNMVIEESHNHVYLKERVGKFCYLEKKRHFHHQSRHVVSTFLPVLFFHPIRSLVLFQLRGYFLTCVSSEVKRQLIVSPAVKRGLKWRLKVDRVAYLLLLPPPPPALPPSAALVATTKRSKG